MATLYLHGVLIVELGGRVPQNDHTLRDNLDRVVDLYCLLLGDNRMDDMEFPSLHILHMYNMKDSNCHTKHGKTQVA